MITYQDLLAVGEDERNRMDFVFNAIQTHKSTLKYNTAKDAEMYMNGKNATISAYQKVLYKITGEAVPDNYTANHKCKSGFFKLFATQEAAYQLGNGVNFNKDATKKKLGKNLDMVLYQAVKSAIAESVSFLFWNFDHLEFYKLTEFVPLYDEEDGALKAGIRFWQIDSSKPIRATLFELDGLTEYIKRSEDDAEVLQEKRNYTVIVRSSTIDGTEIIEGSNYPGFPVIPLWCNLEHQSELEGKREQIDCYDLIKSGFANDLDDASMIYWTLSNAGGMKDIDLAKFIERMKVVHAAAVDSEDGGKIESHTVDVPYQSREVYLQRLAKDLYRDFMALDMDQIAAGNVTATQIKAAYEPLDEKCDELEMCLYEFFDGLFALVGITDDEPIFTRSRISNQGELTQMVLSAAEYLDDETILNHLPFLEKDEIAEILRRKDAEEMARYSTNNGDGDEGMQEDVPDTGEAIEAAEDAKGKQLNGAQTQSLISVLAQYADGKLSEGQATAVIATAIGVTKDEARAILRGE